MNQHSSHALANSPLEMKQCPARSIIPCQPKQQFAEGN